MLKSRYALFRYKFNLMRSMKGILAPGCSVILAIVFGMGLMVPTIASSAPDNAAAAWAAAELKIVRNPSTGAVLFLSSKKGLDSGTTAQTLQATPSVAVGTFLSRYQKFLGMFNATNELVVKKSTVDRLGITHVRLKQIYQGVPVFGAEVMVHFMPGGNRVHTLNGTFIPYLTLKTQPTLDSDKAIDIVREIQKQGTLWEDPQLRIYSGHIDPTVGRNYLAWLVRIYDETEPSRNLYVVDANTGDILTTYNELTNEKNRIIRDAENTSSIGTIVRREDDPPTGDPDTDDAYDFLGATYEYYSSIHGRDSYDDSGATLNATVHYCNATDCPYANAFWNGSRMIFGEGFTVDDVTAHELTHAVTQNTSNLTYLNQSGALNESFSDIFGEIVDLDFATNNDSGDQDWLMGEDIPDIGAIRDMANPTNFGQPDSVSDYQCLPIVVDNGGVHINSGIPNKAAYLMAVGGNFNGPDILPIGREKMGRVQYRTLLALTPSSGFVEYYLVMNQSCQDLIGQHGITSTDCDQVDLALQAVGMDSEPACGGGWSLVYPTLVDTPADLTLLRRYRDEVMANSIRGRLYTRLLYYSSEEALKVLQDNPRLMTRAAQLIAVNTSAIQDVLNGDEGVLQNTDEIIAFLGAYARQSPAGLKFFANMVKSGMIRHKKLDRPFLGFKLQ